MAALGSIKKSKGLLDVLQCKGFNRVRTMTTVTRSRDGCHIGLQLTHARDLVYAC